MSQPSDEEWEPSGLVRLARSLTTGVMFPPSPAAADDGISPRSSAWDPVVAIGWATVDLEHSAAELPHLDFEFAPDDEAMGARALIGHPGLVDLVLLEPSTEGRLAGTLARNGEGIAVFYQRSRGLIPEGSPRMTPFGRPGWLVDLGRRWGPFIIVID